MIDTRHETTVPCVNAGGGRVTAADGGDGTATAVLSSGVCRAVVARSPIGRVARSCVTVRAETARGVWRRAATDGGDRGGAWMACLVAQRRRTGMRALQAEYAVVEELAVVGVDIRRYAGSRHDDSSAGSVEVGS